MPFGGVYEIYAKANKLEEQGKRIIHMEIGRPDFDSPDFAKEAVKLALDKSQVHYTDANGIETLRKAIVEKEERRFGLKYDYETEISIMIFQTKTSFFFFNRSYRGDNVNNDESRR